MAEQAADSGQRTPAHASLGDLARYFTGLGLYAFGGPAAHIALMQDEVVEKRRWVGKQYFLDMLAATQFVPGPNSTEMVIHIGWLHQGWRGLAVAGVCFITPAFLMVLALSIAYVALGALPQAGAVFYGIQPVVVAIIMVAVIKLARTACRTPVSIALAVAAALVTLLAAVNTLWVILGGGVVGMAVWVARRPGGLAGLLPVAVLAALPQVSVTAQAAMPTFDGLFWFFLQVGATAMGSGYVIASYLNDGLVERLGWLTPTELLDAIAVGQMTPGPVFTTAAFAGYVIMAGPGQDVAAGVAGALVSTIAIFLPSFVIVALIAPWVPRLRDSRPLAAFLDGVNAAVVGSIAATALFLLRASVFDPALSVLRVGAAPLAVDLPALVIFATSLCFLLRVPRINSTWHILVGALTGLLLYSLAA